MTYWGGCGHWFRVSGDDQLVLGTMGTFQSMAPSPCQTTTDSPQCQSPPGSTAETELGESHIPGSLSPVSWQGQCRGLASLGPPRQKR